MTNQATINITEKEQTLFFKTMQKHLENLVEGLQNPNVSWAANYRLIMKDVNNISWALSSYGVLIEGEDETIKPPPAKSFEELMKFVKSKNNFKFHYPLVSKLPTEGVFQFLPTLQEAFMDYPERALEKIDKRLMPDVDTYDKEGAAHSTSFTLWDFKCAMQVIAHMRIGNLKKTAYYSHSQETFVREGMPDDFFNYVNTNDDWIEKDTQLYKSVLANGEEQDILKSIEHKNLTQKPKGLKVKL